MSLHWPDDPGNRTESHTNIMSCLHMGTADFMCKQAASFGDVHRAEKGESNSTSRTDLMRRIRVFESVNVSNIRP